MTRPGPSSEAFVRQAFDLLLEIRRHSQAQPMLSQAVPFLKTLLNATDTNTVPVVVSIRAVRLRKC